MQAHFDGGVVVFSKGLIAKISHSDCEPVYSQ